MAAADLFRIANLFVLPGWLLLLLLPRWRWTQPVASVLIPSILSLAYVFLLVSHWGEAQGGFSTLQGVRSLFANDYLLLGGWIHYLAFDLWIGSCISRDCSERQISLLLVAPCLCLTFLFGPAGWLCYQVLRRVRG